MAATTTCGYCGRTHDVEWVETADYPQCIDCRIERGHAPRPDGWVHPADADNGGSES